MYNKFSEDKKEQLEEGIEKREKTNHQCAHKSTNKLNNFTVQKVYLFKKNIEEPGKNTFYQFENFKKTWKGRRKKIRQLFTASEYKKTIEKRHEYKTPH